MNIKMTNKIGEFFSGTPSPAQAPDGIANQPRRYPTPRMRARAAAAASVAKAAA